MEILITADLHANWRWYDWILKKASRYDALIVAGDFLDLTSNEHPLRQMIKIVEWSERLAAEGTQLIFSSGNHDLNDGELSLDSSGLEDRELKRLTMLYQNERWMNAVKGRPQWMGDGYVGNFKISTGESLTITCIPYSPNGVSQKDFKLMENGKTIADATNTRWLVLNHCSPFGSDAGAIDCKRLLSDFEPDFMASGHHHEHPFSEGSPYKLVNKTHCFNAGYSASRVRPCCVSLSIHGSSWDFEWENK